jgi:predicted O-linked N-acetylglucosamine transferase (SPINDLY family)
VAIRPDYHQADSNVVLNLHYDSRHDQQSIYAEHLRWAHQHAAGITQRIRPHANTRDAQRPLRIGYLSPDFRHHSVAFFLEPILAHHDHAQFQVYGYSCVHRPDPVTQRLRNMTDSWRNVVGKPDEVVAAMIRDDELDILIDLAGHTGDSRVRVLAFKPAPVQISYLGYPDTTGLSTVDYRITDAIADPPGSSEAYYTEQLLRLDGCFLCYRPGAAPPVTALPAAQSGHITFASFNNIAKVTEPMLRLWAKLMHAVAGSCLLLKDQGFASAKARDRVMGILSGQGITADRIELVTHEPSHQKHLGHYGRVDVALDTHPYCGTTTTCEAMWMGVPVVSLAGRTHVSRVGQSLLTAAGMPDLAAGDEDAYVRIAASLAKDLDKLASLRGGLRDRVEQSRLVDEVAFTRGLERAYREVWAKWCGK